MNTPTPQPGFAPAPVNSNQWNAQLAQAQAEARVQATQNRTADYNINWVPDWIQHPIESVGSKIHAVYSTVISRPLATPFLAFYGAAAEAQNTGDEWARIFQADTWDKAYQQAKHVSPGQALGFGITHFGEGREAFKKSMTQEISKNVEVAPGQFQKVQLNQTGVIWDNPDAVKEYFDHGIQKYVSGGLDFASSWYLDPLVLGGKAVGLGRNLVYVRPAFSGTDKQSLAQKIVGAGGKTNNINKNLSSSAFGQMSDLIVAQKAKLGDNFSDWATRQAWAKNSANSGALAAALHGAKDQDEVNHVLAISMGDQTARTTLTAKNAQLGAQMEMMEARKAGLIASFPANPNAFQAGFQQFQLQTIADLTTRIAAQQDQISKTLNVADSMFNGMYFMPGVSKIASNFGQHARGLVTKDTIGLAKAGGLRTAGMSLLYNNLYVRPVRIISGTTFNGVRAPGHINVDAEDSYRAFDASLDQAKVWNPTERAELVSKYINADASGRNAILQAADGKTFKAIAGRHNISPDDAEVLYRTLGGMRGLARDGRIYSTATIRTPDGGILRADHVDDAGNLIAVKPVFNTQLENTHIMTDYEHLNKVLGMTAEPFKKLLKEAEIRAKAGKPGALTKSQQTAATKEALEATKKSAGARALAAREVGKETLEAMNKIWKFSVLLRLGYGPRAIADDFMGQAARFGAASLFFERAGRGGRNMANRTMNRMMNDPTGYAQQLESIDMGIEHVTMKAAEHQKNLNLMKSASMQGLTPAEIRWRTQNISDAEKMYDDMLSQAEALKAYRNKLNETKGSLGDNYVIMDDGTAFPRPFEGPSGRMYRDLNSGRRTLDSIMGGTAVDMWNSYRKGNWTTVTRADSTFNDSWMRVVQRQLANDAAAQAHLNGEDLIKWFGTKAGKEYRKVSGIRSLSREEHADRISSTVDHLLPVTSPESAALRDAVRAGQDDEQIMNLMKSVEDQHVPVSVQEEGTAYAMGKGNLFNALDKAMDGYYKWANQLPSEVLSRNPLFFQLYRQHVSDMWQARKDAGVAKLTPAEQQAVADRARALALKDVKKFTFNMDFESKLAFKMRFIAPFFGPMEESFRRWGRIVADRPETIAHAAQIYTSPIHAGHAVDLEGNEVDEDGYATRSDGTRYLVPKSEMHIQFQAPTWVAKALGGDGGSVIDMPINTLNLVLQNDPWYNPGTGPWVQLAGNWTALNTDPEVGDMLTKMGVLQKVTPNSMDQITGSMPKFLSQVLGGQDYEQQQKDMAYLMQSEDYKWKMGLRDKEPTWQEIKDRTQHSAFLRALMKITLPASVTAKDPYQFFRNQYRQLTEADPDTADQVFLAKYGEAAFIFTGALTSNKKKLPATVAAVRGDQKYSYLTEENPDYAQLIVGPYSSGEFSQTAYVQQMVSGDRKINDAREVIARSEANLGWAQYDKVMNNIRAELYQQRFTSFSDEGAEQINDTRKRLIWALTTPELRPGVKNPVYNEEFAKDFLTVDQGKNDRQAAVFSKMVTEASLIGDDMRDDIKGLASYMDLRTSVVDFMKKNRKSQDINAQENRDVKLGFHSAISQLIESNTLFQSLHDRWLTHDMFDHNDPGLDRMGAQ